MLKWALDMKLEVNDFIYHISQDEKDSDKCLRLQCLGLNATERDRVKEFSHLLSISLSLITIFCALLMRNSSLLMQHSMNSWLIDTLPSRMVYQPLKHCTQLGIHAQTSSSMPDIQLHLSLG